MILETKRISRGGHSTVFRALHDGRTRVIKTLSREGAESGGSTLLSHEYEILSGLDLPGVVRPLALEEIDGHPAIVMEDAGRSSVAEWIASHASDVGGFLDLAVQMADIVAGLHAHDVIHRDLCPTNFVLGESGRVTLCDFARATTLTGVAAEASGPARLMVSLPYLAPEQTGRMRRAVDHRADLYSLGATFYEMLVGTPPFVASDPLELIHAHLARVPVAPVVVRPELPRLLSDLVVKLLAKMPEQRYQTAEAVHADLLEARHRWREAGAIAAFDLGRHDLRELRFPSAIHGREREIAELRAALSRAAAGASELVLVKGPAGIGKTALVEALRASLGDNVFYAAGKCTPLGGDTPFASFVEAFSSLARQLSAAREADAQRWRARILASVSSLGRVVTDIVPDLEGFLGPQSALAALGPTETLNRAQRALVSFVRSIACPDQPLVLFLDDVQWSDPGSLDVLRALAADRELGHLLVIVAWRSDEVGPDHPLARAVEDVRAARGHVTELDVRPLDASAVTPMLRDTLHASLEECEPLARVLVQKTLGNPFFAQRFLKLLQTSGLLTFDVSSGAWTWDLHRIAEMPVPDSVVQLLVASIRQLPESVQEALTIGACIGGPFDVERLAAVSGRSATDVVDALWTATREGLIVPVGSGTVPPPTQDPAPPETSVPYRFTHDRVGEAAYALLHADRRKALHLAIGRRLLASAPEPGERIFAIVDQFNRSLDLVSDEGERRSIGELNERAAARARSSAAYASALPYLRHAIELVLPDGWSSQHDVAFRLHRDAAEMAFAVGDVEEAEALVETALAHARSRLEKVILYSVRVGGYTVRVDLPQVLRWGAAGMSLFGLSLPEGELGPLVEEVHAAVEERLAVRTLDDIRRALPTRDPEQAALQRLLVDVAPAVFHIDQQRWAVLVLWAIRSMLDHGHTPRSAYEYGPFGRYLATRGEYERAYAFGRLGVELCGDSGAMRARAVFNFAAFLNHWRAPLRTSVPLLREAVASALETGDTIYAQFGLPVITPTLWAVETELGRVLPVVEEDLALSRRLGSRYAEDLILSYRAAIRSLVRPTHGVGRFDDPEFDEEAALAAGNQTFLACYGSARLRVLYVLGDFDGALAMAELASKHFAAARCTIEDLQYVFHAALTLAQVAARGPPAHRATLLGRIAPLESTLRAWAEACPENFQHQHDLVRAELARIRGEDADSLYLQAIDGAARNGSLANEAMAHELFARFHLTRGRRHVAARGFADAVDAYTRWGALAKVDALEDELRALRLPAVERRATRITTEGLDLLTLLKAAETLSGEVVLDRLLEKMMRICVEAAGARRGALLLGEDGHPVVRALLPADGELSLVRWPLSEKLELPVSILAHVWTSGDVTVLGHAAKRGPFVDDPDVSRRGVKSVLAVPISRQDRRIGALYFENDLATEAFDPTRVRLFDLLSTEIAISLENSLLFEERARAEAAVRFLAEASAILGESLDTDVTLREVARLTVPTVADWCVIDVVRDGSVERVAAVHADPAKAETLAELSTRYPPDRDSPQPAGHALRTGEPLLLSEITSGVLRAHCADEENARLLETLGATSSMAVPLSVRGRTLGAITLTSAGPDRRYGPGELSLAQELARRVANAIDNARLYREAQVALGVREEFLLLASHELRTPLTALRFSLQSLARTHEPEDVERIIRIANGQAIRLGRLVEDLLDVSNLRAGHVKLAREQVNLADLVRGVIEQLHDQLDGARCPIVLHADEPVVGRWDPSQLEQVITNVLMNAAKFGAGKPIEITVERGDGGARLVVADHGIGIADEELPHIFERFRRGVSANHYGGLGLGLYIAQRIVAAHGGSVRAESTLGEGTTVIVELPVDGPPAARVAC